MPKRSRAARGLLKGEARDDSPEWAGTRRSAVLCEGLSAVAAGGDPEEAE
jgi:hypothetical protein